MLKVQNFDIKKVVIECMGVCLWVRGACVYVWLFVSSGCGCSLKFCSWNVLGVGVFFSQFK